MGSRRKELSNERVTNRSADPTDRRLDRALCRDYVKHFELNGEHPRCR